MIGPFSVFFCKSKDAGEQRTCSSTWTLLGGIQALVALQQRGTYPVLESCCPYAPSTMGAVACTYECSSTDPSLKLGVFSYIKLDSYWLAQQHIRQHGAALASVDIFSDFFPFFKATPSGIYPGPGAVHAHESVRR